MAMGSGRGDVRKAGEQLKQVQGKTVRCVLHSFNNRVCDDMLDFVVQEI